MTEGGNKGCHVNGKIFLFQYEFPAWNVFNTGYEVMPPGLVWSGYTRRSKNVESKHCTSFSTNLSKK